MYCKNCGTQMQESETFCTNCGVKVADGQPAAPQPVPPVPTQYVQPPVYQPPQGGGAAHPPSYGQNTYQIPPQPKKKKHIGCIVALVILLLIIGAAAYIVMSLIGILGPKDLGVRYTKADFDSAMSKIGTRITFEGKSGADLETYIEQNKGTKLLVNDYNWKFSNSQRKTFELTQQEATAVINEIAPLFTWFDDAQVKTGAGGTIEGSFKVDFAKVKTELIADVVQQIPKAISSVLPEKFNLYVSGPALSIKNNEVDPTREFATINVGIVPVKPLIGDMTDNERDRVFDYPERIYKQIDGLRINSLTVNDKGNFVFDGVIPQSIIITKKGA